MAFVVAGGGKGMENFRTQFVTLRWGETREGENVIKNHTTGMQA